ncbi:hypothetical protein NM208_g9944 [Fusarium decemcellulare]|uniref:Uncharacterized protein n=1 Tax=Fusarium decemcellulare TaxID=57161 RepID=A0ACC1RZN4_9HYPO|nr:hypothetical protein NM208_g9944 [Fusarium decemcellulare]
MEPILLNTDDTGRVRQDESPDRASHRQTTRDLKPWLQVLVGFLVNFMTWGNPNSYGVYQLYYSDTTDWSSSQISWIGSIQLFLTFVTGTISGRFADAGYARHCILLGSSLNVFGLMMTSIARSYWQVILAQGVCVGIGGGMMAMPAAAAIGSHLRSRRALAMCISGCGAGIGAIANASLVQYLIPVVGFPWAVRCCGFLSLVCAVGANILSRPPLYTRKTGGLIDWSAFQSPFFIIFCINSFATAVLDLPPSSSVQFLLISNAASLLARPLSGLIADRHFGEVNTWNMLCVLLSGMIYAWIGIKNRQTMYMYSTLMGFVNGGAQGLFPSAINSLSMGSNKLGTRLGMVFGICGVASLIGPPVMGAIIDGSGGNYLGAQLCGGTIMAMGSLTVATSRLFFSGGAGETSGWRPRLPMLRHSKPLTA